ncbi:MAG TPA: SusC/RagA family TonB-linked outer membrane protein, partial [Bacteroidales bacterium]
MRLSLIFTFFTIIQTSAAVFSQNVSFNVRDQSMREVLKKIETQTTYRFFYNDQLSGLNNLVTLKVENESVKDVLDELLANQQLSYKLLENNMIVIAPNEIAQQQKITGTVTDANTGEPLVGVSIAVEGTTQGAITDANGKFSFDAIDSKAVLIFSYIGYAVQRINVGGQSVIEVKMSPDVTKLDELVVVGYGVQKKKLATGATLQVKGSDLQKLNTISPVTALQGQTPGVQIVQSSGQPGSNFNINIRGLGTIGNSTPLFIVDGIPQGNINYLNASDIETLDVLKDAASAAIYGARAANGVVLITTKKGRTDTKPILTYDGYFGVQNLYKKAPLLNAKEYMAMMNEAEVNSGLPPTDFSGFVNGVPIVPHYADIVSGKWQGTNWLDEMTVKNAPQQNHTFNLTGGGERSTYSVGFSYTAQKGILGAPVAPEFERYTVRANSEHIVVKRNSMDFLKIGENVTYSYNQNGGLQVTGIYSNDIHNALATTPLLPMWADTTADFAYPYHYAIPWNATASNSANPIAMMATRNGGTNINKNHQITGSLFLEMQPLKNLKWKSNYGLNVNASSYRRYIAPYNLSPSTSQSYNTVTQNMSLVLGWIFTNTLSYEFKLMNDHHFVVLAGTEAQNSNIGESINAQNANSSFDDLGHAYFINTPTIDPTLTQLYGGPGNTTQVNNRNTYNGENPILSYFGRINYDFKEKYMIAATLRRDGSSNFASGHQWGNFPSVSAGWVMTNENFLKDVTTGSLLQYLKLRASWGQNGNQSILPFQYLSTIAFTEANYPFGNNKNLYTIGAYPNILPNKNVTWETSEQTDLGLDASLLRGRMTLTFDWFKKLTKGWLVPQPALDSYGAPPPYVNGGDIQNKGYELALGWSDHIGKLNYTISGNLAYNQNKVT